MNFEDRARFDKIYTSIFFTHAATQPAINAEKLLALMESGLVEVFKLGTDYKFSKNGTTDGYQFIYKDDNGKIKRDIYRYVVNARGQASSIQTDPSALTKKLLERKIVYIEETQHGRQKNIQNFRSANQQKTKLHTYKKGLLQV